MQKGHDVDPREENPRTPYLPRPKKQLRYHDHDYYMFIIITFTLSESTVKPSNKKLTHSCQTLADFLMGKGALRNFSRGETLRAHF